MRQIFLYIFILMVIVPQIAFSQGYGEGKYGEGPYGGVSTDNGNERGSSEPKTPFPIAIKVYLNDEPLNYTLTKIKNLNTGESDTDFTNFNGEVIYELANFETRYLDGDIIEIKVCLNDNRCTEESRNYTVSNSGGIIANFRLSDEQDVIITPPIEDKEIKPPIKDVPKKDTVEIIYINNTQIINTTKYINNSTNTIQYIYQSFIQNITINKNIIIKVVIELVIGIALISITLNIIFKLIKKKVRSK